MMHEQEEYYNFLTFLFSLVFLSLPPGLFPLCLQQLQLSGDSLGGCFDFLIPEEHNMNYLNYAGSIIMVVACVFSASFF